MDKLAIKQIIEDADTLARRCEKYGVGNVTGVYADDVADGVRALAKEMERLQNALLEAARMATHAEDHSKIYEFCIHAMEGEK